MSGNPNSAAQLKGFSEKVSDQSEKQMDQSVKLSTKVTFLPLDVFFSFLQMLPVIVDYS